MLAGLGRGGERHARGHVGLHAQRAKLGNPVLWPAAWLGARRSPARGRGNAWRRRRNTKTGPRCCGPGLIILGATGEERRHTYPAGAPRRSPRSRGERRPLPLLVWGALRADLAPGPPQRIAYVWGTRRASPWRSPAVHRPGRGLLLRLLPGSAAAGQSGFLSPKAANMPANIPTKAMAASRMSDTSRCVRFAAV